MNADADVVVASAIVMLTDLGSYPEEVMSGAQPAHAGGA